MQANHHSVGATAFGRIALVAAAAATMAGCSSPLTTVALREFLRESTMTLAVDSDAEEASKPDDGRKKDASNPGAESDAALADDGRDDEGDDAVVEDISIDRRIERSLERLARANGFDTTASDVLVDTLKNAAKEDWPAIIDSFATSLETSPLRSSPPASSSIGTAAAAAGEPSVHQFPFVQKVAKPTGGLTSPVAASVAVAEHITAVEPPEHIVEVQEDEVRIGDEPVPPANPEEPENPEKLVAMLRERLAEARRQAPLAVRRACFASKVRGWGDLDPFDEPRFVPGQDILVYVELDNLDGIEGHRGFCTRVEARLRLLDATGGVVEQWGFPLVEDRADSPRTDYFVRYLVRIPADATAGAHRLEASLTDAVSSKTVTTDLPLEVALAQGGRDR